MLLSLPSQVLTLSNPNINVSDFIEAKLFWFEKRIFLTKLKSQYLSFQGH